jgi:3-methyl-2-oxobutanoate hydroxymethyltransferase
VLESIPARLAGLITQRLEIPTIGIGAGVGCDGQVLVTNDVLGLYDRLTPKFSKKYKNFLKEMEEAFNLYIQEIGNKTFPSQENVFKMQDEVWNTLLGELDS